MGKVTYKRVIVVPTRSKIVATLPIFGASLFLIGSALFWPTGKNGTDSVPQDRAAAACFLVGSILYLAQPLADCYDLNCNVGNLVDADKDKRVIRFFSEHQPADTLWLRFGTGGIGGLGTRPKICAKTLTMNSFTSLRYCASRGRAVRGIQGLLISSLQVERRDVCPGGHLLRDWKHLLLSLFPGTPALIDGCLPAALKPVANCPLPELQPRWPIS